MSVSQVVFCIDVKVLRPSQYPSTFARSRQRLQQADTPHGVGAPCGAVVRHSRRRIGGGALTPPPYLNNPYAIFKKRELYGVADGDGLHLYWCGSRLHCGQKRIAASGVDSQQACVSIRVVSAPIVQSGSYFK